MRKPVMIQGSPNYVPMDKSPVMVGGKLEEFGEISKMIAHWEGQEEKLKNDEGGGGRQKSEMIQELSMVFEGGGKQTKSCRPKSWGGREEGRDMLHSKQISHTNYFGSKNTNDAVLRTPLPDIAAKSKFSKVKLIFSPANENSREYVTANRKPESRIDTQNDVNGGKSVVRANLRWRGVNPGQS